MQHAAVLLAFMLAQGSIAGVPPGNLDHLTKMTPVAKEKLKAALKGKTPEEIAAIRKRLAKRQHPAVEATASATTTADPHAVPQHLEHIFTKPVAPAASPPAGPPTDVMLPADMESGDVEALMQAAKDRLSEIEKPKTVLPPRQENRPSAPPKAATSQHGEAEALKKPLEKAGHAAPPAASKPVARKAPKPVAPSKPSPAPVSAKQADEDLAKLIGEMQSMLGTSDTPKNQVTTEDMLKKSNFYESEDDFKHQLGEDQSTWVDPEEEAQDQPFKAHRIIIFSAIVVGILIWVLSNSQLSWDMRFVTIPGLGEVRTEALAKRADKMKNRAVDSWANDMEELYGDLLGKEDAVRTSTPLKPCTDSSYGL